MRKLLLQFLLTLAMFCVVACPTPEDPLYEEPSVEEEEQETQLNQLEKSIEDANRVKNLFFENSTKEINTLLLEGRILLTAGTYKIEKIDSFSQLQQIADEHCQGEIGLIQFEAVDLQAEEDFKKITSPDQLEALFTQENVYSYDGEIASDLQHIIKEDETDKNYLLFGEWKIDKRDKNNLELLKYIYNIKGASPTNRAVQFTTLSSRNTWPDGIIPYYFEKVVHDTIADTELTTNTKEAMKTWEEETQYAVTFLNLNPSNNPKQVSWLDWCWLNPFKNSLRISKTNSTSSFVVLPGYGNLRTMYLGGSPPSERTIVHELGHVLGLWHEQQRNDRTNFICVPCLNHHYKEEQGMDYFNREANNHYLLGGWGDKQNKSTGMLDLNSIMLYGGRYTLLDNIGSNSFKAECNCDDSTNKFYRISQAVLSPEDKHFMADLYNKSFQVKDSTPKFLKFVQVEKEKELIDFHDVSISTLGTETTGRENYSLMKNTKGHGVYILPNSINKDYEKITINLDLVNSNLQQGNTLYLAIGLYRGQRVTYRNSIAEGEISLLPDNNLSIFVPIDRKSYTNQLFIKIIAEDNSYKEILLIIKDKLLIPESIKYISGSSEKEYTSELYTHSTLSPFIFQNTNLTVEVKMPQGGNFQLFFKDLALPFVQDPTSLIYKSELTAISENEIFNKILTIEDLNTNEKREFTLQFNTISDALRPESISFNTKVLYNKGDKVSEIRKTDLGKNSSDVLFLSHDKENTNKLFINLQANQTMELKKEGESIPMKKRTGEDFYIIDNLNHINESRFLLTITMAGNSVVYPIILKIHTKTVRVFIDNGIKMRLISFGSIKPTYGDEIDKASWSVELNKNKNATLIVPAIGELLFETSYLRGTNATYTSTSKMIHTPNGGMKSLHTLNFRSIEDSHTVSAYINWNAVQNSPIAQTIFVDSYNDSNSLTFSLTSSKNVLINKGNGSYRINSASQDNVPLKFIIRKTERRSYRKFMFEINTARFDESFGKETWEKEIIISNNGTYTFKLVDYKDLGKTKVDLSQTFFTITKEVDNHVYNF